jgi:hypothetical protein
VSVTTNFGAYDLGCSNADTDTLYTFYLKDKKSYSAHLALDIANGLGEPVYAIASGKSSRCSLAKKGDLADPIKWLRAHRPSTTTWAPTPGAEGPVRWVSWKASTDDRSMIFTVVIDGGKGFDTNQSRRANGGFNFRCENPSGQVVASGGHVFFKEEMVASSGAQRTYGTVVPTLNWNSGTYLCHSFDVSANGLDGSKLYLDEAGLQAAGLYITWALTR